MNTDLSTSAESSLPRNQLHVLTLTPFYPSLGDDATGCFIAESLPWVEKLGVKHTVLAIRPFYYRRLRLTKAAPAARWRRFFSLPSGIGLPSAGAFLCACILPEVRRLHAVNPVQVIHAHSALPCGHAAALISRELGIPFVVTVHGIDAYSTNQVGGWSGRWCERVSRFVYYSAHTVICVSQKVREQVMERASAGVKTAVVYNGVDPQAFSPAVQSCESEMILSVGTLIPIKGHALLLRAFAEIQDAFPRAYCQIIGDGPERPRLQQLATNLKIAGKVIFLGRQNRSQVAAAMRHCALFALPSRYEGLGCVYLEAMATGKAVIACRGQGIDEVIRDESNGLLVQPDDHHALREALSLLLQSRKLRDDIGLRARSTVLERFTLAHQAAQLTAVYRRCAT
jgi:teichuronic acid biosynthesis glycosyltransferase TuaC